ncbi:MAG: class I SAM-dependent rRNA methyltransferase [Saprospiraceae bacterium]|nr:class I SAM-dependent rRNA methyltransferase [Saprospiraceae bacterium]
MENNYSKIYLKHKKDNFVRRFHPWIFSGAIAKTDGYLDDGSIVEVYSNKDEFLAIGHYHRGSIAVKIFSYEKVIPDAEFWFNKLHKAFLIRQKLGFTKKGKSLAYRLVHGEGDGLPGLIIDVYERTIVIQAHSIGMYLSKGLITEALKKIYTNQIDIIYDKSKNSLPKDYAENIQNSYLWGTPKSSECIIDENSCQFYVNWDSGQKTGFFLDQRDNRFLLKRFSEGKRVLNAFCYSGGFSVYALKAGAAEVHSVDSSAKAIEMVEKNILLNGLENLNHKSFKADVMKFLKEQDHSYDLMILDPPAFAKTVSKRHKAVQAYKRLNIEGLKLVAKGGVLFTFSCSQVVDNQLFYNTVTAAAIEAKRKVRVLYRLTQPADHPVNIFHPEGNYLKGLVLYVE